MEQSIPTNSQTVQPMEELDDAHQLETQIQNLKNMGWTWVRDAMPHEKLKDIQDAFDQKMNTQIAEQGKEHKNTSNRFDLMPLWQEPVFRQLVNLPKIMPIVRGYMKKYWDDEPVVFHSGHGHCLFGHSPAHQGWHNDSRPNSGVDVPFYIRLTFLVEDVEVNMGPTAVLSGTHGTHVNVPAWFNAPDRQPRRIPDMVLAAGTAGDCLINDTSIYHSNTPNRSDHIRKVIWALYAGSKAPIWVRTDLPKDHMRKLFLSRAEVGDDDDPEMAALFRHFPDNPQ
jgi:ectoine hydroxylase